MISINKIFQPRFAWLTTVVCWATNNQKNPTKRNSETENQLRICRQKWHRPKLGCWRMGITLRFWARRWETAARPTMCRRRRSGKNRIFLCFRVFGSGFWGIFWAICRWFCWAPSFLFSSSPSLSPSPLSIAVTEVWVCVCVLIYILGFD